MYMISKQMISHHNFKIMIEPSTPSHPQSTYRSNQNRSFLV